ncbi:tyrosine-type recombinase/integrase [Tenacibaculum ovolyticum]|uniref:tyrosine-type recombinase/integrase n=1 Tax=Tenacibaculum ovolyticum TaxID=104270 RepID=UPI001F3D65C5|nr:tyrosine-type recombinase/integrase [Tenacibaculum ovolyticum]
MNSSFRLKYPKTDKESLIYFTASFKNEGKTFVYSTGEKIHPKDWDFKNKRPSNLAGRKKDAETRRIIDNQLSRYKEYFNELGNLFKSINEELTIEKTKDKFNIHFKNNTKNSNDFFNVYELFLKQKKEDNTDQANTKSTIDRYGYNKDLLKSFSDHTKYKLRFKTINKEFYNKFIKYCVEVKRHSANTLSRNIGLLKTFLYWSIQNKFTYFDEFKDFKNIKRFATDEVALTKEQIDEVFNFDLTNNNRLRKVRDLFIFGASTSLRFENFINVNKRDIYDGFINVIDVKDKSKTLSIPINHYSKTILEKYDYVLPVISNQNFNKYIKELFKLIGYNEIIKKTMKYGNEIVETESFLYERISSHTARRSFITIMKNNSVPDKIIMSYTGHKSLEVFNNYYRPNQEHRINFMNQVFN